MGKHVTLFLSNNRHIFANLTSPHAAISFSIIIKLASQNHPTIVFDRNARCRRLTVFSRLKAVFYSARAEVVSHTCQLYVFKNIL